MTLYTDSGLVTCRAKDGKQTPSLQGFFPVVAKDVRDALTLAYNVLWVVNEGGIAERRVSRTEWFEVGEKLVERGIKLETRRIDDKTLLQMRLEKGTVPDETETEEED